MTPPPPAGAAGGRGRTGPQSGGRARWWSVASWKAWATSSASASLPGAAAHCIDSGIPSAAEKPVGIAIAGAPVRFQTFVLLPEDGREEVVPPPAFSAAMLSAGWISTSTPSRLD
jgi:hypothetical protein